MTEQLVDFGGEPFRGTASVSCRFSVEDWRALRGEEAEGEEAGGEEEEEEEG